MVTGLEILIPKIVIVVAAGMAAWGFVRDFLAQTLIPAIRLNISASLANAFTTIIKAIDNVESFSERAFIEAFNSARQLIRATVRGAETVYRKLSANRVSTTTTIHVQEGDKTKDYTVKSEIPWIDVPPKIKDVMLSRGSSDSVRSDLKDELIAAITKKVPNELIR
jgi:hypothetical protein